MTVHNSGLYTTKDGGLNKVLATHGGSVDPNTLLGWHSCFNVFHIQ